MPWHLFTRAAAAAGIIALAFVTVRAMADDTTSQRCSDSAIAKKAVADNHGKWARLTPEQWQFMRGIYVLNPGMPEGLPLGDSAALIQIASAAAIVFLDGDRVCGHMMPIPDPIVAMLIAVGAGEIRHAGQSE